MLYRSVQLREPLSQGIQFRQGTIVLIQVLEYVVIRAGPMDKPRASPSKGG